jgi:aminoglycoside phosphotransferase (APT) family kinase protein
VSLPLELLRAPPREVLDRLCAAVLPGGRVARVRRLRGGLDAGTHALDLAGSGGERLSLVLRRPHEWGDGDRGEELRRQWRLLGALARLGLPAPRPVLLDETGALFGTPAIVTSRLPGRAVLAPRRLEPWLSGLAEALGAIHRATAGGAALSFLPNADGHLDRELGRSLPRRTRAAATPAGRALLAALERGRAGLTRTVPALIHGDYWAGNTVWLRGRLTGVVDWGEAQLGAPAADVGYCRMDLAMLVGPRAPDLFLRAYERAMDRAVADLWFWDLLGALRALPDPAVWLPGYHDLGRADMTAERMRARLHGFIARALARTP